MTTKKAYVKPVVLAQKRYVFDDPQAEALPEDIADAERLRPLYLLSERTDLTPIAARFVIRDTVQSGIHNDARCGHWQKVLHHPGTLKYPGQQESEGKWYFLCHVPHSGRLKIEIQTLGPDAKTRIAVADGVSIPSDRKLGLVVLPKKQAPAPFSRSTKSEYHLPLFARG